LFTIFWQGRNTVNNTLNIGIMKRAIRAVIIIILVGGLLIWVTERNAQSEQEDPNIKYVKEIPECMWWSFTTVFTLGYASHYNPVTVGGRIVTIILIITGLMLIGVLIATLTSLYIRDNSEEISLHQARLEKELNRLSEEVKFLSRQFEKRGE